MMLLKSPEPWPHTHRDVIEHYYQQYHKQIASGEFEPFVYPFGSYGAFVVIAYLLIPHQNRPWLKKCRFLVFAFMLGFAAYSILYTRARGMAPALGMGLVQAWGVVYVAAILVWNDAQIDFQRIERTEGAFGGTRVKGDAKEDSTNDCDKPPAVNGTPKEQLGPSARHGEFAWQSYPLSPFVERLDWVCDLFLNFRGAGWSWRTSALPPPPKRIQSQLHRNSSNNLHQNHTARTHRYQPTLYSTRAALLSSNLQTLIIGYLTLDLLKTLMMHDPYFWGQLSRPPPPYFPHWLTASPAATHAYRLLLSMVAVKAALQTIFSLAPLFFSGVLGPQRIGARAEPWIFPETWGPFAAVLERGLGGWWSAWWHQTFRFAFSAPGAGVARGLGWDVRGVRARVVNVVGAFVLSGILHACGTYTAAGETRPWRNSMGFFLVQGVGVVAEVGLTGVVRRLGLGRGVPAWMRRGFTFVYVHVWFYYTAHLLCDDFSLAGVWLFEPVPVSLFRGLGFGVPGEGWWCWDGTVMWWHTGSRWWKSGIAM